MAVGVEAIKQHYINRTELLYQGKINPQENPNINVLAIEKKKAQMFMSAEEIDDTFVAIETEMQDS